MAVKVIHHPGKDSDFIISEPEGGQVVIKLPEHAANIILAEFEFVLGLLRMAVEDEARLGGLAARAYLEQWSVASPQDTSASEGCNQSEANDLR